MTSIGTGYDLQNSVFSPDGRNFQVEYAVKAVEAAGTSIGIRCHDGVILATERIVTSKLSKPDVNRRISSIDKHIGLVGSGLIPDERHLISRARDEASSWRSTYKTAITTKNLASRLGSYAQAYTLYSSVRPLGISALVGGIDGIDNHEVDAVVGHTTRTQEKKVDSSSVPQLYMIEPSGLYWGYYGAAAGKGRQIAKTELEKLNLSTEPLSLENGVREAARIMLIAHEDSKDKDFELEMTWISTIDGPTQGRHEAVPPKLLEEAEESARRSLEGDDEEEQGAERMQEG